MGPNTKKMLEALNLFFTQMGQDQAEELWAILSALRGPDNEDFGLKVTSTAIIRNAAFPNLPVYVGATSMKGDTIKLTGDWKNQHFERHAKLAADVLGLKVEYESEKAEEDSN